jgi:hypothetical protein
VRLGLEGGVIIAHSSPLNKLIARPIVKDATVNGAAVNDDH